MTLAQVRLSDNIIPKFYPVHTAIKQHLYTTFWLKGGRGSTKSSFTAIEIILGIIQDKNANAVVLRKVGDTIRASVLETLLWAIDTLQVTDDFRHTKAPAEITYKPTGQKILFKGLDDPQKLKSIKIKKGYFKFLWFEEATEFDGPEEIRNVGQSVMRGGKRFVEFITYNPPNDPNAWVNKEAELNIPDRLVHESCYLDVPREWLGPKFLQVAENLKVNDYLKYEHEYLGRAVGRAEQIIFHGKWKEKEFITPHTDFMYEKRFFYGADWGFANDPSTLLRCFIRVEGDQKNLYIDYEAGDKGIELEDLPKMYEKVPGSKKWKIYADCARPETISFMYRKQYNIEGAPKWEGSVEDGVEYLKSFNNIYIHPRCTKTIEEFKKYSYKVDKNTQEILPVIVDKWNHWIDALRYALADYIKSDVSILDVV